MPQKKFAYICGGARHPFTLMDSLITERSDAFINFFQSPGPSGTYYLPDTTTNTGRNAMFELASQGDYEYIIAIDDDLEFPGLTFDQAFRKFEALIDEFTPGIAVPKYSWHFKGQAKVSSFRPDLRVQGIGAADAIVNAFHRDLWPIFFPYWCGGDSDSWWNAQQVVHRISHVLQPGLFVQLNDIEVRNLKSADYPRHGQCRAAEAYLKELIKPEFHDMCGHYQRHDSFGHFEPYLCDSYKFTRDELAEKFDLSHEYWRDRPPRF